MAARFRQPPWLLDISGKLFSISRKNTENNARLHLLNFGGMKKRSIISALLKPGFRRDFSFLI
ncbi:MAG: hypothetical protein JNJ93_02665 [Acinetobacter sp.]|nr:hypothetical protein [Acinetobacter sp.]